MNRAGRLDFGQEQEREQAGHLGLASHQGGEQPGQSDRLPTQIVACVLTAGRAVRSRVLYEVGDVKDGTKAIR